MADTPQFGSPTGTGVGISASKAVALHPPKSNWVAGDVVAFEALDFASPMKSSSPIRQMDSPRGASSPSREPEWTWAVGRIAVVESARVVRVELWVPKQRALAMEETARAAEIAQRIREARAATERDRENAIRLQKDLQSDALKLATSTEAASRALSLLTPLMENAKVDLMEVDDRCVVEMQSYPTPPVLVRKVLECAMVLLGADPVTWAVIRDFIRKDDFLAKMSAYDSEQLVENPELLGRLQGMLAADSELNVERVGRASKAAGPVLQFVQAVVQYAATLRKLRPEQARLAVLREALTEKEVLIAEAQVNAAKHEESLVKLQEEYKGVVFPEQARDASPAAGAIREWVPAADEQGSRRILQSSILCGLRGADQKNGASISDADAALLQTMCSSPPADSVAVAHRRIAEAEEAQKHFAGELNDVQAQLAAEKEECKRLRAELEASHAARPFSQRQNSIISSPFNASLWGGSGTSTDAGGMHAASPPLAYVPASPTPPSTEQRSPVDQPPASRRQTMMGASSANMPPSLIQLINIQHHHSGGTSSPEGSPSRNLLAELAAMTKERDLQRDRANQLELEICEIEERINVQVTRHADPSAGVRFLEAPKPETSCGATQTDLADTLPPPRSPVRYERRVTETTAVDEEEEDWGRDEDAMGTDDSQAPVSVVVSSASEPSSQFRFAPNVPPLQLVPVAADAKDEEPSPTDQSPLSTEVFSPSPTDATPPPARSSPPTKHPSPPPMEDSGDVAEEEEAPAEVPQDDDEEEPEGEEDEKTPEEPQSPADGNEAIKVASLGQRARFLVAAFEVQKVVPKAIGGGTKKLTRHWIIDQMSHSFLNLNDLPTFNVSKRFKGSQLASVERALDDPTKLFLLFGNADRRHELLFATPYLRERFYEMSMAMRPAITAHAPDLVTDEHAKSASVICRIDSGADGTMVEDKFGKEHKVAGKCGMRVSRGIGERLRVWAGSIGIKGATPPPPTKEGLATWLPAPGSFDIASVAILESGYLDPKATKGLWLDPLSAYFGQEYVLAAFVAHNSMVLSVFVRVGLIIKLTGTEFYQINAHLKDDQHGALCITFKVLETSMAFLCINLPRGKGDQKGLTRRQHFRNICAQIKIPTLPEGDFMSAVDHLIVAGDFGAGGEPPSSDGTEGEAVNPLQADELLNCRREGTFLSALEEMPIDFAPTAYVDEAPSYPSRVLYRCTIKGSCRLIPQNYGSVPSPLKSTLLRPDHAIFATFEMGACRPSLAGLSKNRNPTPRIVLDWLEFRVKPAGADGAAIDPPQNPIMVIDTTGFGTFNRAKCPANVPKAKDGDSPRHDVVRWDAAKNARTNTETFMDSITSAPGTLPPIDCCTPVASQLECRAIRFSLMDDRPTSPRKDAPPTKRCVGSAAVALHQRLRNANMGAPQPFEADLIRIGRVVGHLRGELHWEPSEQGDKSFNEGVRLVTVPLTQ